MKPAAPAARIPRRRPVVIKERAETILAKAAELFAKEGFRNTDLQDVADALQMGKASVYRRFPTKRDLFLATLDRAMLEMKVAIDAAVTPVSDPLEQIAAAVRAYLAFFDSHPHYVELLMQERADFRHRKQPTYFAHRRTNIQRWRALYEQLIEDGRVRRMPVDRITDVLSSAVYGTMFTNFFSGRTKSLQEQAADILDVVFHGILEPGAPGGVPAHGESRTSKGRRTQGATEPASPAPGKSRGAGSKVRS